MWQACFYNEKAFQIEYNILLFLNSHLTCHRLRDYPTTRYLNCQCIINDVLNLYFCWHYCCMKAALLYWLIPDARESVACYTYYIYIKSENQEIPFWQQGWSIDDIDQTDTANYFSIFSSRSTYLKCYEKKFFLRHAE